MPQSQDILKERYQLQNQLGLNSGRQTWLAQDLQSNGELVVVKLLTFGGDVQWEDLKLFEREAQVLKQLNHPRIPKYRDYFSIDERSLWFGLVQEYIQGSCLKQLIVQGQKFTESQIEDIVTDTLEILIYLHGLNPPVLHRDIKPSNLIWSDRQEIYLVDFGAVQDKASAEGKTFTVVGTYGYAPMEQYGGRAVPASDLYALGATAIHLLTGTSPAELPQDDELNIQFRDRSGASPQLLDWVQKMTAPSPKRRFASAREALDMLHSTIEPIKRTSNNSPSHFKVPNIKIPQPPLSKVKIERSATHLLVTIPPSMWAMVTSACLSSVAIFIVFFISTLISRWNPTFAIGLLLGTLVLSYMFVVTNWSTIIFEIDTNHVHCRLVKRIFRWQHFLQKFNIRQIEYIHTSMQSKTGGSVIIQNRQQLPQYPRKPEPIINRCVVGDNRLTELETAWLAQEIQTWLQSLK
ncbi:serine/threonine protein kinase [Pseudanabaena sp. FACHB-1998]|uniref:serine/threonine protein kinase n=1 Tax=Pseudanabaena sp. FACHB-1998 TaxID=2692858 RepID=UPI00168049F9|nr:serine/threonine-protein kinase [Pseudanabaena sp. FACHB-1998]MBD2176314.1 serine/threonine protein kinase [Pseudanabaena sp. FACHB-1998]